MAWKEGVREGSSQGEWPHSVLGTVDGVPLKKSRCQQRAMLREEPSGS